METKNSASNQQDLLEMVMKDMAEEQTKNNHVIANLVKAINGLTDKVNGIAERLNHPPVITVPDPDTRRIEQLIEKGIQDIRLTISACLNKPKPTRFQLFMESKNKTWFVVVILGVVLLTFGFFFLLIYFLTQP